MAIVSTPSRRRLFRPIDTTPGVAPQIDRFLPNWLRLIELAVHPIPFALDEAREDHHAHHTGYCKNDRLHELSLSFHIFVTIDRNASGLHVLRLQQEHLQLTARSGLQSSLLADLCAIGPLNPGGG